MKNQETKYYLGLDIGIGSVGWGIIGEKNGEHWLEDFGVRLFNVPEESGGGKGKKTYAEKRREFRGKRRLLNRWYCRREDLKKFFFSLFVSNYPNLKKDFEEFTKTKKTTNLMPKDLEKYEEKSKFFNPYIVRYQALSTKVSLVDLLNILLHIGKYRGYKKFYLDSSLEEKDKKIKEVYAAAGEVKKIFQENNYHSAAEMAIKNEKFHHSQHKNLLSAHNHNPKGIELKKIDKKSEKLSQDSQANEIIKQIIEETDKENLKWEKGKKFYDAIIGNKDKEIDGLDDNKLSNEKKKVKLQEIVADKFGKLNHKHFVFPRELLEYEVEKILEKQSENECYPQLKDIFEYTLYENGEIKKKKISAQEIIKAIIFRQRDFEDGPTETKPKSREKKDTTHWKKHNRNITFTPFTETTGYCQYFLTKRRGWHCSIIYCCYQIINEFSKIGGLEEKELGGLEKVKEIHQQVFKWLISPTGYQLMTLSKEEKESGKKRETIRKQLEKFLNKLVGKENYSFLKGTFSHEKGIKFKTDFLDCLKENSSFYSVLWKNCPSEFYLNCKDYEKTIFYQIGQIIFERITPRRRKKELDNLSQKVYSLEVEAFQDCLARLEKYSGKRSPASVSFHYMIEAIKAFLDGKKYGEFQAEAKKELEEKLKISENNNKNKKMWSPWMHPDLVRNPVVFRSFNQTRKILRNLFLNYPQGFATINIETGRNLWNSEEERSEIRQKYQDREEEKNEIKKRLEKDLNVKVNETNILKYRLWEDQNVELWTLKKDKKRKGKSGDGKPYWDRKTKIQETRDGGICLYCNEKLDLYKLKEFEREHILPRGYGNNSFDNSVLAHKTCNNKKGNRLPFHFFQKYKTQKEWLVFKKNVDNLYKERNKEKHKFLTLGEEGDWERELEEDFISRNINDTRHIAIKLKQYVETELNKKEKFSKTKTKVLLIKGSITSYYRRQIFDRNSVFYYKKQLRSLTPYHHAIDAIVLAHFKSRGYIQLMEDLITLIRNKRKLKKRELTQEEFDSCYQKIVERWSRENSKEYRLLDKHTKNAIKILESVVQQKENNISKFFLIPNLENIVGQRIPVQIEKYPIHKQGEKKEIEEVIIEVKKVLTESEYYENIKDKGENIHYPYISWVSDQKVKKEFIASEQPGYRKKERKFFSIFVKS